jgi:hypothetical protein
VAQVVGFDPAISGQQPRDLNGDPVPVGVWGDSDTGGGVFGTSGVLPDGTSIPINPPAGVEGHGVVGPGVVGRSVSDNGVLARSESASGVLGVMRSSRWQMSPSHRFRSTPANPHHMAKILAAGSLSLPLT